MTLGEIIAVKVRMKDQMNRLSLAMVAWMGTLLMLPVQAIYISISAQRVSAQQRVTQISQEQVKQQAQSITVKIVSGDNGGSGILIRKQGQVYTVLTNQHVLELGKPTQIQTPDGKTYQAHLVSNVNFKGKDLALLQFRSSAEYVVASLGNLSTVAVNEPIFSAGFPFKSNSSQSKGFVFRTGQVLLLSDRAFKEGYQIGYSNDIEKGMSGGPILNSQGKVIGINGIHAYPLWGNPYIYEDGSQPTAALRDLMSRYSWGIPIQTFARLAPQYTSAEALPKPNTPSTQALPPIANEVNNIAQEITVGIDPPNSPNCGGSGVIIAKQGSTYTVLTAEHVVRQEEQCDRTKLEVLTPDGQRYPVSVNDSTVKSIPGADIAVLQFTSNQNYRVATLAKYDLVKTTGFVFVSEGLRSKPGVREPKHLFTAGRIVSGLLGSVVAKNSLSLTYGYGLAYTNVTEEGMSGGPILDTRGRVIGIHGRAEEEKITDKAGQNRRILLGFSLGVPVSTFLSQAQVVGLKPEFLKVETSAPPPLTDKETNTIIQALLKVEKPSNSADAIDWLNYGWQVGKLREDSEDTKPAIEAVRAIDRAIQLQPNFYQAWYLRGFLLFSLHQYAEALKSFNKATQIEPKFYPAWRWRGLVLFSELKQYQEALESFDKVLQHDPKDSSIQIFRSIALISLERFPEAFDAANQVVKSNPTSSWAYLTRATARIGQKDFQRALADLNEAIRLNPEYIEATAYNLRGLLRAEQKDIKGALADLNEAVRLDPKDAKYIKQRGAVYLLLKDYKSAIADFTVAIRLKPDDAQVYLLRGQTRTQIRDNQKARQDFQKAADLYKQQGKMNEYQNVLAKIKQLPQ